MLASQEQDLSLLREACYSGAVNYLAHLYLAGDDDAEISGALLGDFVKGRLENLSLPPAIIDGIRLHRSIDSYTDAHPLVIQSRQRLQNRRRVAGIIVDIIYDHFLARHWQAFAVEALDSFCQDRYERLLVHLPSYPPRLQAIVPHMAERDWLGSYAELDNVALALERIGRRLSQPDMLSGVHSDLQRHYSGLEQDFMDFFPELTEQFARHDRLQHPANRQHEHQTQQWPQTFRARNP